MSAITDIHAEEIVDSRGKPALSVTVVAGGARGTFAVPSGASTGEAEALEMRDADGHVTGAMRSIREYIAPALAGMDVSDQRAIDVRLLEMDGTAQKSRLGGNAMIGVSIAAAKAAAAAEGVQVFEHLRSLADIPASRRVPLLYMNYINGGKHALSPLSIQEHIIVPQTEDVSEALSIARAVEDTLGALVLETYGEEGLRQMGDEGGFVIPEHEPRAAFDMLFRAVEKTGVSEKVRFAMDAAASSFYHDGTYALSDSANVSADALMAWYQELLGTMPFVSIEDPFEEHAQDDFVHLQKSTDVRIVGDDLTVTDAARVERAARAGAIRAVIIKPNQIGTLTETLSAMRAARNCGIDCIVSHRSGETMDDFIADLAFAFGTFGLKAGAPRKEERRVKYERLAAIAAL